MAPNRAAIAEQSGEDGVQQSLPRRRFSSGALDDNSYHRVFMLTQHFFTLLAEIIAVVIMWSEKLHIACSISIATLLLSGCFCWYVAWTCREPDQCGCGCLPFQKASGPRQLLCFVPMTLFCALCQCVLVPLTISERVDRSSDRDRSMSGEKPSPARWHCKAVIGIFENIIISGIVFYEYLGDHQLAESSVVIRTFGDDFGNWWKFIALRTIWILIMVSAGIGIVELDECLCSSRVRMLIFSKENRVLNYLMHLLYRTSEIIFRMSIHIYFILLTAKEYDWRSLIPLALSLCLSFILIYINGGHEVTFLVRLGCAIPCVFVNIFRFIDSPYKGTAARRLSNGYFYRTIVELLALPCLLLKLLGAKKVAAGTMELVQYNPASTIIVGMSWLVFLALRFSSPFKDHAKEGKFLFESCQTCDVQRVEEIFAQQVCLDVNSQDVEGETPLVLALCSGRMDDDIEEVCKLLVREGAKPDLLPGQDRLWWRSFFTTRKRLRWTPLHMAAYHGVKAIIDELLPGMPDHSQSEPVWYKDARGDTPLHVAVRYGKTDVVKTLKRARPDWLAVKNHDNQTPAQFLNLSRKMRMELNGTGDDPEAPLLPRRAKSRYWKRRDILVTRDVAVRAPGICSFVAAAAGGPICSAFLQEHKLNPIAETEETEDDFGIDRIEVGSQVQIVDQDPSAEIYSVQDIDEHTNDCQVTPLSGSGGQSVHVLLDKLRLVRPDSANGMQVEPVTELRPRSSSEVFADLRVRDLEPVPRNSDEPCQRWRHKAAAGGGVNRFTAFTDLLESHAKEAVLGQGQFGKVWKAKCKRTGLLVAVKNMLSAREGDNKARVAQRECKMADVVRTYPHPCVVALHLVHQFGQEFTMLAMEYCPNGDLLQAINQVHIDNTNNRRKGRPYTAPKEADVWMAQIFLGLEHLHTQAKAILRDLKPDNIVLSVTRRVKLTDFGYGRVDGRGKVQVKTTYAWDTFGGPPGTPGYVAPEVIACRHHNHKADLYSLGVVYFMLLTGGFYVDEPNGKNNGARTYQGWFLGQGELDDLLGDHLVLRQIIADPLKNPFVDKFRSKGWRFDSEQRCLKQNASSIFLPGPLPAKTEALVLGLLHDDPEQRFDHDRIRKSEWFRSVQPAVPTALDGDNEHECGPQEVEGWLEKTDKVTSNAAR